MARTVNERSPLYMTVVFKDENDTPLIPTTVEWRLDDLELDQEIVGWTALGSPAASMSVIIPAGNNIIVNETKVREARMFGIRINQGLSSEANAEFKYHVLNLNSTAG